MSLNLEQRSFVFQPGPVFTHLLLADEINRASPKTQSALLEAMAEGQVSVEGKTYPLEAPFLVLATMNPLDHEGTYPLPAAQLDRFTMQLTLGMPGAEAEIRMLDVHLAGTLGARPVEATIDRGDFLAWQGLVSQVYVGDEVKAYIVALANQLRADDRSITPPSPRSVLMLARCAQAHGLADGRPFVKPSDVQAVAPHVLAHRLVLERDETALNLVLEAVERVPVPR